MALAGVASRHLFKDELPLANTTAPAIAPQPEPARLNAAETPPSSKNEAISPILADTNKLLLTADQLWDQPVAEEAFARFHDWANKFIQASDAEKPALEAEGVLLSKARRQELLSLIQSDPERALNLTVPLRVREELPDSITAELEERISGRGRLAVLGALAEPGKEMEVIPVFRTATVGNREFKAFVYGRRLGLPTRDNIPLNGIALDGKFAVNESPSRILEPAEAAAARGKVADPICSVSGLRSTALNQEVISEVAGEPVFHCRVLHAAQTDQSLIAGESGPPGPAEGPAEPSTWTEGLKKVILIRVDFPDLVGQPLADTTAITLISNLNFFYTEMSYARAGFYTNGAGSDFTPTFRMPQPASWYGTNDYYNQLRTDARNAATAAGYNLNGYDRDVICMGAVPGFGWSGLAYVGAAGAWLRSSFSTGVAGHELGHNWGLNHANYWDTSGQSTIGSGTSIEYGDIFDTMGSASAGNNHFNARYKAYLNWLTTNDWVTATSNGIYRIYAHDDQNSYGTRALRIVKNPGTNYWVELRQKFTGNRWLMSGAGLRWAQNGNERSQLLDTTPGSTDGKNDTPIVIGRTFSDTVTGIHITPIGKGGTIPESLDVVVNLGFFPGNLPPVVALSASGTNAATGVPLSFTATAADPDGDTLAYYWDFGDGTFGTNGPAAAKSWAGVGEYVVRCVVSDMKGGVGSESIIVTIGSPTTYRIAGQISTTNGPLQGVRVYVSTTRMAYTDSDGSYTIVGLPGGTYTVNASLENYTFANAGFSNPLTVGPNFSGADFLATYTQLTAPAINSQPLSQTVNPGATVTFSVGATGSTPLYYQWRFNGANIAGATLSSYTKTNVQATNAGNYSVVVSNLVGTATSANAVLAVNTPPLITAQPQSQSVIAGNNATFSVTATGTAPLYYQWRLAGTNIAGATASTCTCANVQLTDAGSYFAVVSNSLGSVTSAPALLTVNFTLLASASSGGSVTKNPDQQTYPANTVVTLTATSVSVFPFSGWSGDASGTDNPLSVIMTANKSITANFTSPVPDLIIDNPSAAFVGAWTTDTTAADKYGSDYRYTSTSQSAGSTATFVPNITTAGRYDVYLWFPTISKGLASAQFVLGTASGNITNTVSENSGSGGWQLLATAAAFAQGTNGFVRLSNAGTGGKNVVADAVRFAYAQNQAGTPPIITSQPQSQAVIAGQAANFSAVATGTAPLSCQWYLNGAPLSGATGPSLLLTNVQPINAGPYTMLVTNLAGSATSAVATLTVLVPPQILAQPASQRALDGASVAFAVDASGTQPLTFQWLFNSIAIGGKTNGTLSLAEVHPPDAGDYTVTISNAAGSVTSLPANLAVSVRPLLNLLGVLSNGHPQLRLTGTPGDRYLLEYSTNLVDWTAGATITNVNGVVQFIDTDSTDYLHRFYRCRLQ